jgi:tripartite-type tricarboxylate transporter receptor subunit TctC
MGFAALLPVVLAAPALAQSAASWPDRAIRLVVPFPAGGATDLISRVVAQQLQREVGQSVVVDNKPGAGGTIGAGDAARSPADGYTLLMTTSSTHSIGPHMSKPPYDPVADFTPIAHVAEAASMLLVPNSLPVRSVAELVAHLKQNPAKLNFASSGHGTIVHLTAEAFMASTGTKMEHIPYRGTALSIPDLMAGTVHVLFDSIPSGMPHVQAGSLRALAVTGTTRSTLAPDLPTLQEAGVKDFNSVTWFGIYAPKGLAPELATRINGAIRKALASPEVTSGFSKLGVDPVKTETAADFAAMVAADSARWGALIRDANIKLQP